jgi:hypothetical protein
MSTNKQDHAVLQQRLEKYRLELNTVEETQKQRLITLEAQALAADKELKAIREAIVATNFLVDRLRWLEDQPKEESQ